MFDLCFNFLAEMTFEEKMVDAVTVTIVGMGIVFVSLFVMGEIFKLLGQLLIPKPAPEEQVSAPPVAPPVPVPAAASGSCWSSSPPPRRLRWASGSSFVASHSSTTTRSPAGPKRAGLAFKPPTTSEGTKS
jgi:Na+-transporting methylmalonyl-CoA/oxaloacetate decarboxylase gamma subunit